MGFQNVFDQFIGWRMADSNKNPFAGDVFDLAGINVFHFDTFNAQRGIGAVDFVELVEPQWFDLWVLL